MGKKRNQDDDDQDEEGGSAGGSGKWVPNYYELMGISPDEKELPGLIEQSMFEQRVAIKAKGFDVTALSKIQKLRNQLDDPSLGNAPGGGSLALDQHPELAEMGGDVDPNHIVLPDSEAAERAGNDPQLRLRLAAKLGMSSDVSLQSMKEEYKKKMEMRSRPKPDEPAPRYRPSNAPKPRPN